MIPSRISVATTVGMARVLAGNERDKPWFEGELLRAPARGYLLGGVQYYPYWQAYMREADRVLIAMNLWSEGNTEYPDDLIVGWKLVPVTMGDRRKESL